VMVLRLAIDETKSALRSGEASRAIRQAEVGAAKTMIERTQERFDLKPEYLAADTAYGSAAMLNWVVCPPSALMRQIGRVKKGRISGSS
jgi:hypothetical protein